MDAAEEKVTQIIQSGGAMKHFRYAKYLARHKWFVLVAGLRIKAPLWRLLIHDWSKFLPCEWFAYARYFYGDYPSWDKAKIQFPGYSGLTTERVSAEFDAAWLHHQHANPHHWQHWILREDSGCTKVLPMPEHFAREMVADWMGAGRAIKGKWDVGAWYGINKGNIQLNPATREKVEQLVRVGD